MFIDNNVNVTFFFFLTLAPLKTRQITFECSSLELSFVERVCVCVCMCVCVYVCGEAGSFKKFEMYIIYKKVSGD